MKNKIKVEFKSIPKNSIIFLQPKSNDFNLAEIERLHEHIQSLLPNNKVITIPTGIDYTIDEWEEIYTKITKYLQSIKPQKGDIND